MTRRELALLHTARSTNLCLDRHQSSWKTVPGFAQQREVLRTRIAELDDLARETGADRGNLTGQRQAAIQALAESAWVVAGQVQAWAAVHGDEELRQQVQVTRDDLVWEQMGLPERALQIHFLATQCLRRGDGGEFGLSAAGLDVLAERIQALKILRSAAVNRGGETQEDEGALAGGLEQVMDLLCEVTDPLMRRFRVEEPEFFEAYQVARRIVDPDTGTLVTLDDELACMEAVDSRLPGGVSRGEWRAAAPSAGGRTGTVAAALNS